MVCILATISSLAAFTCSKVKSIFSSVPYIVFVYETLLSVGDKYNSYSTPPVEYVVFSITKVTLLTSI